MKNLLSILAFIALIGGCQSANEGKTSLEKEEKLINDSFQAIDPTDRHDTVLVRPGSDLSSIDFSWTDYTLTKYIAFADSKLIKNARTSHIQEEWLFDQTLQTDSAVYQIYQIGHDVTDEGSENARFVTDQWVYLDTTRKRLYELDMDTEELSEWWTAKDEAHFFYPVYELSPKTTAFVISFREPEQRTFLDTIFNSFYPADSIYNTDVIDFYKRSRVARDWKFYDTSGYYKLMRSEQFEKEARKYFDSAFYIYGTKGYAKSKIKNIAFGLSECITNIFAFCLDNNGIKSIGHPVFCSTKLIELNYGKDYSKLEKSIDSHIASFPSDYSDSIKTKVMGNINGFYFLYHDDFLWGRNAAKSKCRFPDRNVLLIEGKNILGGFGDSGLDLFGIGCD